MIAKLIIDFGIQKIVATKFCDTKFTMISLALLFRFDCDFAEGFEEGCGNFVGVAHGGADILVAHGLLHCIRIAVGCELQGTVSMAETMKSEYWNWRKKGDEDKT